MYTVSHKSKMLMTMLAASAVLSSYSFAEDGVVQTGLDEAVALYAQRSATNPKPIEDLLAKLAPLEGKADDSDLNYKVLILESRALYWKGAHSATNEEKMALHAEGQAKADLAKTINDGYAEAYYFAGINLARWGEAKGVLASLSRKAELVAYMNDTMNRMTMPDENGNSLMGESIDGNGPDRVLGKVYFVLPLIFGGSHTESVKYLSKAYADSKNVPLNVIYYAETLNSGDAKEKVKAKQILDDLLLKDPTTYNPNRVPESIDEFDLARKLRAQMG